MSMNRRNKLLALVLAFALICAMGSTAFAIDTAATSTCVMDVDTGRILYEDNDHEQRPIASITKIMTGYLACELSSEEDLQKVLTCSERANKEDGSSLYMEVGDKITLESCIYGTMLRSGNDAAMLLAETIGGDEESFVKMMNEKAQEIGMTDTLYGNPNGLVDEGNYSTAYDMCLLGRVAMRNKLFAKVVGTNYIETEDGWAIENHNRLLDRDSRCVGIKTGWTTLAGRTLVSCFEDPDSGQRVVICTLNDSDDFNDHIRVADWALDKYPPRTLCQEGRTLSVLSDEATGERFCLNAENSFSYPLSKGDTRKVSLRLTLPDRVEAPEEGGVAGVADFYLKGHKIGSTNLIYARSEQAD